MAGQDKRIVFLEEKKCLFTVLSEEPTSIGMMALATYRCHLIVHCFKLVSSTQHLKQ